LKSKDNTIIVLKAHKTPRESDEGRRDYGTLLCMSIESQEKLPSVSVETLELSSKTWEDLKEDILRIEKECFGETGLEEEDFTNIAHSPDGIVALLKKGQKILGYTIGGQDENEEKTITIYSTAITPEEQGMGYVESLVGSFESEARKRGYLFHKSNEFVPEGKIYKRKNMI